MLLLDTCTLLWLAGDKKELSDKAHKAIQSKSNELFVSAATAWEIAIKTRSGKLKFGMKMEGWYREALVFLNIREIYIDGNISFKAAQLEPIHNDPFDRIIIATALIHRLTLVTCDEKIRQYKEVKVVW